MKNFISHKQVYTKQHRTKLIKIILDIQVKLYSVQFNSVTKLCLTLCNPMDCSTPGFHVHHQLPELAQTHVHQVSGIIQPSLYSVN